MMRDCKYNAHGAEKRVIGKRGRKVARTLEKCRKQEKNIRKGEWRKE